MKIALGSDHAGIKLKQLILDKFTDIEFEDVGTYTEESTDYPDWISIVGTKIQDGEVEAGIVICGTGIGASIVANKIKGIRAALCHNGHLAEMAKKHNNANVLALGARVIGDDLALKIVETWLTTPFDGGRHQRRLDKISALEENQLEKYNNKH
ncbi:MAG: ribose 5-phosphate isomerase B [bacterium]|nr:ribose 5-phosphate isomerase B [bacterium]